MEFPIASRRRIFCDSLVIISALSLPEDNPSHHKRFGWDKNLSCFVFCFCFFLPATVMHNELLGRAIEFLIRLGIYFFASFLPEPTSFWPILCLVIIRITTDAHTRITTDGPLQLRLLDWYINTIIVPPSHPQQFANAIRPKSCFPSSSWPRWSKSVFSWVPSDGKGMPR